MNQIHDVPISPYKNGVAAAQRRQRKARAGSVCGTTQEAVPLTPDDDEIGITKTAPESERQRQENGWAYYFKRQPRKFDL